MHARLHVHNYYYIYTSVYVIPHMQLSMYMYIHANKCSMYIRQHTCMLCILDGQIRTPRVAGHILSLAYLTAHPAISAVILPACTYIFLLTSTMFYIRLVILVFVAVYTLIYHGIYTATLFLGFCNELNNAPLLL